MPGHLTYLVFELSWSLPVLMLQWVVGRRWLWDHRGMLLVTIAVPTIYLAFADSIAIAQGIWRLHANRIVGLRFGNVPLEEVIFFAVTNALVAQSVLLVAGRRRGAILQSLMWPTTPPKRAGREDGEPV